MTSKKPGRVANPDELLQFDTPLRDTLEVPENHVYIITDDDRFDEDLSRMVESLAGKTRRDWFERQFYYCLPLLVANQVGFLIRLLDDYVVRWDGSAHEAGMEVQRLTHRTEAQALISHFGHGIVTLGIQAMFRTPAGVNLFITPPPNFPLAGATPMMAMVETDNLRNDFTLNLKIDRADTDVYLPAGTPLAALVPVNRHFTDHYTLQHCPPDAARDIERQAWAYFEQERFEVLGNVKPALRYARGMDIFGTPFADHQVRIPGGQEE